MTKIRVIRVICVIRDSDNLRAAQPNKLCYRNPDSDNSPPKYLYSHYSLASHVLDEFSVIGYIKENLNIRTLSGAI